MKTAVQHTYGSADTLHLEDIDKAVAKDNEVSIRVCAVAISRADWVDTTGRPLISRLPMVRILRALVMSLFVSQTLRTGLLNGNKENLDLLRDLIESGQVTPVTDRAYPLSEMSKALRYFAQEHARAKIAITV